MKYIVSEIKYLINEQLSHLKNNAQEIYSKLVQQGYVVVDDFISPERCDQLRDEFDFHAQKQYAWKDVKNSDYRIHAIENVSEAYKNLFEVDLLSSIYKKHIDKFNMYHFSMANRVEFKENNLGSGGGWHRDVINRRQLKFITYLNDVDENNGCFQYIPFTHTVSQKFKTNHIMGLKTNSYRYTNEDIDKLFVRGNYNCINLIGKKGTTIVVDTSGIHRGAPIILPGNVRYAVTHYMSEVPFNKGLTRLFAPNYNNNL